MPNLTPHVMFSKVKVARELLREQAEEIYRKYMENVLLAQQHGEHEVALKALQWLMEHMPKDDDGGKLLETSVDKQQPVVQQGPTGPAIQIGIQVGGTGEKKSLPKPKKALPTVKVEKIENK